MLSELLFFQLVSLIAVPSVSVFGEFPFSSSLLTTPLLHMYGVFEAQPSASASDSGCRKGVGEFFRRGGFSIVQVPLTFFAATLSGIFCSES